MICQWQGVLNVLPPWMRQSVDELGRVSLQELRLRLGQAPQLCMKGACRELNQAVTAEDLRFVINTASKYSPWAYTSASKGYITLPGGHRIGMCGEVAVKQGTGIVLRWISSLCIRISRDFPGISRPIQNSGSILIIGAPGSGKTTLLRDLIRTRSDSGPGSVCVVDERWEIFPASQNGFCYSTGKRTDILSGCPKQEGVDIAVRCMGPKTIAMDEITAQEDCDALIYAGWCGVELMATAHAGSLKDLMERPVYKPILKAKLFSSVIVMNRDNSFFTERIA